MPKQKQNSSSKPKPTETGSVKWEHGAVVELPIDSLVVNDWDRVIEKGTVFVSNHKDVNRRYVYYQGRNYVYSNVLWNAMHPDDVVRRGEVIHHRDNDAVNDSPVNHVKLTRSAHMVLHNAGVSNPFYGRTHTDAAKRKMSLVAIEQGRRPPSRKGASHLTWDIEEAINLKSGGASWVELSKRYKVSPSAVSQAFKRRAL